MASDHSGYSFRRSPEQLVSWPETWLGCVCVQQLKPQTEPQQRDPSLQNGKKYKDCKASIHFQHPFPPELMVTGDLLEPLPAVIGWSQGNTLDKWPVNHRTTLGKAKTEKDIHTMDNLVSNAPQMHVFGLRKEAGEPGENPRWHRENMQLHTEIEPTTLLLWGNSANPVSAEKFKNGTKLRV